MEPIIILLFLGIAVFIYIKNFDKVNETIKKILKKDTKKEKIEIDHASAEELRQRKIEKLETEKRRLEEQIFFSTQKLRERIKEIDLELYVFRQNRNI